MDWLSMAYAAILGVVEGLTEFLPISSTGHLILTSSLLGLHGEFWDGFEVAIQFGAIIAVMWVFRERIKEVLHGMLAKEASAWHFATNVLIATLPAVLLVRVFGKAIKAALFNPVAVAIALIMGGVVIIWAEKRQTHLAPRIDDVAHLSTMDALKIGLAQTLAVLLPGTSRSGATIIGGMLFGVSRQAATQFSFFLAMPILFGAFLKGLSDIRPFMDSAHSVLFAIGFVSSMLSAFVCVRWLLRFVSTNNFIGFAWYRIVFGALILLTWGMGWVSWTH